MDGAKGYRLSCGDKIVDKQRFGIQAAPDPRRRQDISNIFNKVFVQSQGRGLTQAELIDKMHLAIKEYDAEQIRKVNELVE